MKTITRCIDRRRFLRRSMGVALGAAWGLPGLFSPAAGQSPAGEPGASRPPATPRAELKNIDVPRAAAAHQIVKEAECSARIAGLAPRKGPAADRPENRTVPGRWTLELSRYCGRLLSVSLLGGVAGGPEGPFRTGAPGARGRAAIVQPRGSHSRAIRSGAQGARRVGRLRCHGLRCFGIRQRRADRHRRSHRTGPVVRPDRARGSNA